MPRDMGTAAKDGGVLDALTRPAGCIVEDRRVILKDEVGDGGVAAVLDDWMVDDAAECRWDLRLFV